MIKKTLISVLVLILTLSSLSAEEIVKIVTFPSPYFLLDKNEEIVGPYGEIYKAAFKAVNMDIEMIETPIKRGIELLFANQVDAHSPGSLFITGDLQKNILWESIGKLASAYVHYKPKKVNTDLPIIDQTERIGFFATEKMTLGVNKSNPILAYYEAANIKLVKVETMDQQVQLLSNLRVDYSVMDQWGAMVTIAKLYPKNIKDFGIIIVPAVDVSLAFSKGNPRGPELFKKFQEGLSKIKQNGTFMKIMEKYWGKGNVPKNVLTDDMARFGIENADTSKVPIAAFLK
ncbi:MAG: transporter substrate-binding domain-containing protein [Spirochaetales bacterium]|nr:transporter substrate-binding domain-containing protein [Spirochaetales bacterium]